MFRRRLGCPARGRTVSASFVIIILIAAQTQLGNEPAMAELFNTLGGPTHIKNNVYFFLIL